MARFFLPFPVSLYFARYDMRVQQADQVSVLRGIIERFEALKSDCSRGLLTKSDVVKVIIESQEAIEAALQPDSTPNRVFRQSHMRGVYTSADLDRYSLDAPFYTENCKEIEDWIGVVLSILRELSPQDESTDLRKDLIREIQAQKNLMVSVATGGPRINTVDQRYQERQRWIRETLRDFGLEDPNPYDSLWDWRGKWSSGDLPTYQERRTYLAELFTSILRTLEEGSGAAVVRAFPEPTGWVKIDRNLAEAQSRLASARAVVDFQQVGLISRETLTDLAQEVFDPDLHPVDDVQQVSKTDAKRMLDAYLAYELKGAANEEMRKHARAASTLANALTHRRTAAFREAALCLEATASLVNIVAIIAGRRNPA